MEYPSKIGAQALLAVLSSFCKSVGFVEHVVHEQSEAVRRYILDPALLDSLFAEVRSVRAHPRKPMLFQLNRGVRIAASRYSLCGGAFLAAVDLACLAVRVRLASAHADPVLASSNGWPAHNVPRSFAAMRPMVEGTRLRFAVRAARSDPCGLDRSAYLLRTRFARCAAGPPILVITEKRRV